MEISCIIKIVAKFRIDLILRLTFLIFTHFSQKITM